MRCPFVGLYLKKTRPNFMKSSVHVNCGRGSLVQSSSDENAVCRVLPVLCMTSCFRIMEHGIALFPSHSPVGTSSVHFHCEEKRLRAALASVVVRCRAYDI